MPDPFSKFIAGAASKGGKRLASLIFDGIEGNDSDDSSNQVAQGFSGQGEEMIRQVGENADSAEDIPNVLNGTSMTVDFEDTTLEKSFNNE